MPKSKDVEAWFARYQNPMKEVVQRMRDIILDADTRIEECIKWQAPTFVFEGNLASFFPKSKQHATLMFHLGARIPGDFPRLEGGGNTGRVMKIGSVAEANATRRELERIVRAWCDWRASSVADAGTAGPSAPAKRRVAPTKKARPAKPRPHSRKPLS